MKRLRTRRPDARPDEILAAARDVFSERGLEAARMDEIAKRAGLSKGALYHYFDSKEALFEALIERSAGEVAAQGEAMVAAAGGADPEATLRQLLSFVCHALTDPKLFAAPRLILAEGLRYPSLANFYRTRVIDVGMRAMTQLLASGVEKGVFRPIEPRICIRAVIGPVMASAFLLHIFEDPDAPPPDELALGLTDMLLNGLSANDAKEAT